MKSSLLFATFIVKLTDRWASFTVARKAVAVGISWLRCHPHISCKKRVTYSRFLACP